EYQAVGDPRKIWRLMMHDGCAESVKQRGSGIEHEVLPFRAEHLDVVKDRREEDTEGEQDFDDVFHVTKEETGRRDEHTNASGKQHHDQHQDRSPEQKNAPANFEKDQQNDEAGSGNKKVEEAGENRRHWKNFFREVNLDDEASIVRQAKAGE